MSFSAIVIGMGLGMDGSWKSINLILFWNPYLKCKSGIFFVLFATPWKLRRFSVKLFLLHSLLHQHQHYNIIRDVVVIIGCTEKKFSIFFLLNLRDLCYCFEGVLIKAKNMVWRLRSLWVDQLIISIYKDFFIFNLSILSDDLCESGETFKFQIRNSYVLFELRDVFLHSNVEREISNYSLYF